MNLISFLILNILYIYALVILKISFIARKKGEIKGDCEECAENQPHDDISLADIREGFDDFHRDQGANNR